MKAAVRDRHRGKQTHHDLNEYFQLYKEVTGRFHSICPKLCVSLFEEIRGWATAAKATVSKDNIDSKLRFMRYFLFWCTNVGVLDEFFTTDYTD